MKKLLIISAVLLFAVFSCDKGEMLDIDMLAGDWTMENPPYPFFTPTLSFSNDGQYSQTNVVTFTPFQSLTFAEYTVTGNFVINGNTITFTTASVVRNDDAEENPYGYTGGDPIVTYYVYWSGSTTVIRTNDINISEDNTYTPVVWEVLELTDHVLKVKRAPASIETYIR